MPPPYIMPSILPKNVLPVILASARLRARSPQNVKNMVTSMPIAAAPVPMMKAPNSLSMSPLITTIEIFFGASAGPAATAFTWSIARSMSGLTAGTS